MQEYDLLKQLVAEIEPEVARCEEGNKAAGTRVRKHMQEVKKAVQAVREKVLSMREPASPPTPPAM